MKVNLVNVYGLEESVVGSKFPMAVNLETLTDEITDTTKALGSSKIGSGHDNFLNGITVMFDLTCSNKMWVEMQRYHFMDFVSSQSTMHRILKMDIRLQCNQYVWQDTIDKLEGAVEILNTLEEYITKELYNELYLDILYNIPAGFQLTARMTTNYRQLKTIYYQRKNHRLPEWREFCKWCEGLPMFKELCLGKVEENV